MFGDGYVGGVEFAVADDLDFRDAGDFLADEFKDGAAEVARDAAVGLGARELLGQESVIKPLATRGEAIDGVLAAHSG